MNSANFSWLRNRERSQFQEVKAQVAMECRGWAEEVEVGDQWDPWEETEGVEEEADPAWEEGEFLSLLKRKISKPHWNVWLNKTFTNLSKSFQ